MRALVLVLAACGSSRAPAPAPAPAPVPVTAPLADARAIDAPRPIDAHPDAPADAAPADAAPDAPPRVFHNPKGCPATFAAAGGACKVTGGCDYPEGHCSCMPYVPPAPCGGGAAVPTNRISKPVRKPPPPPPPTWQCTPAVRADGCPGSRMSDPCTTEGKTCNYGDCCFTAYTCHDGKWIESGGGCPP